LNIKKIIEKFNHNGVDFSSSIGISDDAILMETIYDWLHEGECHSRIIERILTHKTLTDNEKIFSLIVAGQVLALGGLREMVMRQENDI